LFEFELNYYYFKLNEHFILPESGEDFILPSFASLVEWIKVTG